MIIVMETKNNKMMIFTMLIMFYVEFSNVEINNVEISYVEFLCWVVRC